MIEIKYQQAKIFLILFIMGIIKLPDAAYPKSGLISDFVIDGQRISIGNGDNWPMAWADNGGQYTFYHDGSGFGGQRHSMGPAEISGNPPSISGQNIASPTGQKYGDGRGGRKVSSLTMVEGVLYGWVRNLKINGTGSSIIWSSDHAKTWTWAAWSFQEIGYPGWVIAGQNNDGAEDDFIYFHSPNTNDAYAVVDGMIMGRVPKDKIKERAFYEFYSGLDLNGNPNWSSDINQKSEFFHLADKIFRPSMFYNSPLKKYFLATTGDPWAKSIASRYLGIFEAPHPWGPWSVVKEIPGWGGSENRFAPHIPSKWINNDGLEFYLVYSCYPNGPYKLNLQKVSLTIITPSNLYSGDIIVNQLAALSISPNPFNPSTTITFPNPNYSAAVTIYDLKGREAFRREGIKEQRIRWDASGLPNGIYHVRVSSNDKTYTKQITLLK